MKAFWGFCYLLTGWGIVGSCLNMALSICLPENEECLISFLVWWELLVALLVYNVCSIVMLLAGEKLKNSCAKLEGIVYFSGSFATGLILFFGLYSTIRFLLQPDRVFLIFSGCAFFAVVSIFVSLYWFYWLGVPLTELKTSLKTSTIGGTLTLHIALWFGLYNEKIFHINNFDLTIRSALVGIAVANFAFAPLLCFLCRRAWRLSLAEELGGAILFEEKNANYDKKSKVKIGIAYLEGVPNKVVNRLMREMLSQSKLN